MFSIFGVPPETRCTSLQEPPENGEVQNIEIAAGE